MVLDNRDAPELVPAHDLQMEARIVGDQRIKLEDVSTCLVQVSVCSSLHSVKKLHEAIFHVYLGYVILLFVLSARRLGHVGWMEHVYRDVWGGGTDPRTQMR